MKRLESLANILVIAVAVAILGAKGYQWLMPAPTASEELSRRWLGKPLTMPTDVPFGTQGTVTVFVSKDCRFCTASMDFYRRLAEVGEGAGCDLKLNAVGPKGRESQADLVAYVSSHNLAVDSASVADFVELKVDVTPTLVLTDRSKTVRGVWFGSLRENAEMAVISMMKGFCAA